MRYAVPCSLALLLAASAVRAQEPQHVHRGFWIGFGLGIGQVSA